MNTKRLIVLAAIEIVAIALGVCLLLRIPVHTSDLDSHTGAKQDVESRASGLALPLSDRLGEVPPIPSGRDRYSGHGQGLRQT
jgi:hypothetical protein